MFLSFNKQISQLNNVERLVESLLLPKNINKNIDLNILKMNQLRKNRKKAQKIKGYILSLKLAQFPQNFFAISIFLKENAYFIFAKG
jgi:hypothetical protein